MFRDRFVKIIKFILVPILVLSILIFYIQFYSSISFNIGNSEWWINHHNYIISDWNSKDVYIITENKWFIKYTRYNVKKNDAVNIVMNENEKFIMSLYSHEENHGFKWRISNQLNVDTIQFSGEAYMEPSVFKEKNPRSIGGSTRRQNLYFKTIGKGEEKIDAMYAYEGDMDKIKATGNYDIVMDQQFSFRLNLKVK